MESNQVIQLFAALVWVFSLVASYRIYGLINACTLFMLSMGIFQGFPFFYNYLTNYYSFNMDREAVGFIIGILAFFAGYALISKRYNFSYVGLFDKNLLKIAWLGNFVIFPVTFGLSVRFFMTRFGQQYGLADPISGLEQVFFYAALFFLTLGLVTGIFRKSKLEVAIFLLLVILPRGLISLTYSRIFVLQAIIPIVFAWFAYKKDFRLSNRGILGMLLIGISIFIIPAITRSQSILESQRLFENLIMEGSTISILNKYEEARLETRTSYVYASIVLKAFPFLVTSDYYVNVWGIENAIATLDRDISSYQNQGQDVFFGTGSNFIHELYIDGGYFFVILGSLLLGLFVAFIERESKKSVFFRFTLLIMLTSFLFLPRSNYGYMTEKLPLFLGIYLVAILFNSALISSKKGLKSHEFDKKENFYNVK
jgi:O-antigen polysaccharide polymerase Wzy